MRLELGVDWDTDGASETRGLARHDRQDVAFDVAPAEVEDALFAQAGMPCDKACCFPRFLCGSVDACKLLFGERALVFGGVFAVRDSGKRAFGHSGVNQQKTEDGVQGGFIVVEALPFAGGSVVGLKVCEGDFGCDLVEVGAGAAVDEAVEDVLSVLADLAVFGDGFVPVLQFQAFPAVRAGGELFFFRRGDAFPGSDFKAGHDGSGALMQTCGFVFRHELRFHRSCRDKVGRAEIDGGGCVFQASVREGGDGAEVGMPAAGFASFAECHSEYPF